MEKRRHVYVTALLLLSCAGIVMGPVTALLVFPFLLGLPFAYGFEISRPVADEALLERRWGSLVHGLTFAFVPGLLALAVLTLASVDLPVVPMALVTAGLGFALYGASVVGAQLASWHILRRRGSEAEMRLAKRFRWAAVGGVAWFALFLTAEIGLARPSGGFGFDQVANLGVPAAAISAAGPLCLALRRIYAPIRRASPAPAPVMAPAPTFTPFRF